MIGLSTAVVIAHSLDQNGPVLKTSAPTITVINTVSAE